MISKRKEDSRLETIINEFVDKYYFKDNKDFSVTWIDDEVQQRNGIDMYLTSEKYGLDNVVVDAKAAVKYMYMNLKTFIMELSSVNNPGKLGWFINDGLATEYYLLLWPFSDKAKKDDTSEIKTPEDINYVDFCLVKKSDVRKFVDGLGYTKDMLFEIANDMRDHGEAKRNTHTWDMSFSYSAWLKEKPVNAVIKKYIYERMALIKGRIEKHE